MSYSVAELHIKSRGYNAASPPCYITQNSEPGPLPGPCSLPDLDAISLRSAAVNSGSLVNLFSTSSPCPWLYFYFAVEGGEALMNAIKP